MAAPVDALRLPDDLRGGHRSRRNLPGRARLELLEPVGDRLTREIRRRARHLHEGKLERQARVAALAHVLDRDGEQVAEPEHGRLADLVRLLAQALARLLGDGQCLGHLAQVLDE